MTYGKVPAKYLKPEEEFNKELYEKEQANLKLARHYHGYFFEVYPKWYHVLPGHSVAQEEWVQRTIITKQRNPIIPKSFPQEDGSRFYCVTSRVDKFSTMKFCGDLIKENVILFSESKLANEAELRHLISLYPGSFKLKVYGVHQFVNGLRVIPLLILDKSLTFWDLSTTVFKDKRPVDELGILVEDEIEALSLGEIGNLGIEAELIIYQSNVRICLGCFRLNDFKGSRGKSYIKACRTIDKDNIKPKKIRTPNNSMFISDSSNSKI